MIGPLFICVRSAEICPHICLTDQIVNTSGNFNTNPRTTDTNKKKTVP